MIEAQILCSNPCDIPDLGIVGLRRGDERWVSLHAANSSSDLRKEQAKGNVRVYRKSRRPDMAPKRPPPPFVAGSRPQHNERGDARPAEPERVEVVRQELDTEKLKAELLGDLLPGLRAIMVEELAKSQAAMATPQAPAAPTSLDDSQLESTLERVVRRVMPAGGSVSKGGSSSGSSSDFDEPLYIPTNMVDKDAKAKIALQSKESEETEDLDEAKKALRAMKKAAQKKKNE